MLCPDNFSQQRIPEKVSQYDLPRGLKTTRDIKVLGYKSVGAGPDFQWFFLIMQNKGVQVSLRNANISSYIETKWYSTGGINGETAWVTDDEAPGKTLPFFSFADSRPFAGEFSISSSDSTPQSKK